MGAVCPPCIANAIAAIGLSCTTKKMSHGATRCALSASVLHVQRGAPTPGAVAVMLRRHSAPARQVATQLVGKRRLFLVGTGASWHAALTAEHWFRKLASIHPEAQTWRSFEFVVYPPPGLSPDDAGIVISHRGAKTYSFEALDVARARGVLTIAISSTNAGPRLESAKIKFQTMEPEKSAALHRQLPGRFGGDGADGH